jgi:hypothetical protein
MFQEKSAVWLCLSHRRGWISSSARKVFRQSHPPSRMLCSGCSRPMLHSKQWPHLLLVLNKGLVQQHQPYPQQNKLLPLDWSDNSGVSAYCQELSLLSPMRLVLWWKLAEAFNKNFLVTPKTLLGLKHHLLGQWLDCWSSQSPELSFPMGGWKQLEQPNSDGP